MATWNNFGGNAMTWAYFLTVQKQKRVKRLTRQEGKVLRIYPKVSRAFPELEKNPRACRLPLFQAKKWSRMAVFKHFWPWLIAIKKFYMSIWYILSMCLPANCVGMSVSIYPPIHLSIHPASHPLIHPSIHPYKYTMKQMMVVIYSIDFITYNLRAKLRYFLVQSLWSY